MYALLLIFIWIRATLPRLRADQLMRFAWLFLMPLTPLNLLVRCEPSGGLCASAGSLPGRRALSRVLITLVRSRRLGCPPQLSGASGSAQVPLRSRPYDDDRAVVRRYAG